jgi:hypothetical protein
MGVSGQRHAPEALYPRGKDPWYPLYRRLGGPQSWSGTEVRGKISCLCRRSNLDRPVVQSVARLTELPRFSLSTTQSLVFKQQDPWIVKEFTAFVEVEGAYKSPLLACTMSHTNL